jgi:hypothetical protein
MARTIANVSAALIFGSIFNRMKLSQTAIQDRLGLLQVTLHFTSCFATLRIFYTTVHEPDLPLLPFLVNSLMHARHSLIHPSHLLADIRNGSA